MEVGWTGILGLVLPLRCSGGVGGDFEGALRSRYLSSTAVRCAYASSTRALRSSWQRWMLRLVCATRRSSASEAGGCKKAKSHPRDQFDALHIFKIQALVRQNGSCRQRPRRLSHRTNSHHRLGCQQPHSLFGITTLVHALLLRFHCANRCSHLSRRW